MKLVKVLSVFALSTLLFNACSTNIPKGSNVNIKKDVSINNTSWKLVEEDEIVKGFNGEDVHLTITENGTKVNGFAGCNRFSTETVLSAENISFSPIASTKMLCPTIKTEDSFLALLEDTNRYEIKGNELYFYKGNMLLLKFKSN